jgi:hypothetical protein
MPTSVAEQTPFMNYFKKRFGSYMLPEMIKSKEWFRQVAASVARFRMPTAALRNRLEGQSPVGRMIFFQYDPKLKAKLPYYDTMPLVMVLGQGPGYFLGLNMHYLPPDRRAQLLDYFLKFTTNTERGTVTAHSISTLNYQALKALASDRLIKPTIKKYLLTHILTEPVIVNPVEWDIVIFLPTARWVGPPQGVSV